VGRLAGKGDLAEFGERKLGDGENWGWGDRET